MPSPTNSEPGTRNSELSPILLAGCGDLGMGLGALLADEGHDVWGLRRRIELLPDSIHGWSANLNQPDTLTSAPRSFATVVYTATPDRGSGEAGYRSAYVDGIRNLIHALPSLQRFVLVSSTSVYAQEQQEDVNEESLTQPTHYSGQAILEGEQLVLHLGKAGCVVRFGGIYGPRRTSLLRSVQQGKALCYDGPARYTNRIHRDDCVRMLHHILQLPNPEHLYLGVDSAPVPKNDVIQWLAEQLNAPLPSIRPSSEAPAGRRTRSNKQCRNNRILETGFTFQYPTYKEGYGAIIANHEGPF